MNQYEVTFIVDPVLSGDEIKVAAETYRDLLKDEGCNIVSFDDLGLKQLAYTIKKRNSGVYYTVEFNTTEGLVIPKLELSLRRDERIIRFLSVKLDKYGVKYNDDKRKGLIGKKEPKKKVENDKDKDKKGSQKSAPAKAAAPATAAPAKEATPAKTEEVKVEAAAPVAEKAPVVEKVQETKVEEVKVTEKVVEAAPEAAKVAEETKVTEKVVAAAPVVAKAAEQVTEKVETPEAKPAEVVTEKVEKEAKPSFEVTDGGDNFTKIEGVGPKTHQVLRDAGLKRYRDLAALSKDEIKAILEKGGAQFNGFDPSTWSQQAQLAEDGKWDELKQLQDKLDGGKIA